MEEESFLHNSGLYNVFATRVAAPTAAGLPPAPIAAILPIQQLQQATPAEQPALLVAYLRTVVAQVAGIAPATDGG